MLWNHEMFDQKLLYLPNLRRTILFYSKLKNWVIRIKVYTRKRVTIS